MQRPGPEILFVSKPLSPPWDDSGKLLPWLISQRLTSVRPTVLVPKGSPMSWEGGRSEELYSRSSSFRVPMLDKTRLMWWLAVHKNAQLVHFFFSPNRATTAMGRQYMRIRRGGHVLQTVMSLPKTDLKQAGGLFGDTIVVWSDFAKKQVAHYLQMVKRPADRPTPNIVHIPPGIVPIKPMTPEQRTATRSAMGLPPERPVFLFSGDLEFSQAATRVAEAAMAVLQQINAVFVFACRPKTPEASRVAQALQVRLAGPIAQGQVRFPAFIPHFPDLLRCVDVQLLPAETTYAKTDIPLVLLEGMSAAVPVVVGLNTPMDELVEQQGAIGVHLDNPQNLTDQLLHLATSHEARRQTGEAGQRLVLERYTATHMAKAHDQMYQEILHGNKNG